MSVIKKRMKPSAMLQASSPKTSREDHQPVKSRVYSASRKQTALPDGVWLSRGPLCCLSDYADNGCRIKCMHRAELQVRASFQSLEPPGTTGGSGA